jgi:hypothetical protein
LIEKAQFKHGSPKFALRFLGPFKIVEVESLVSYKIDCGKAKGGNILNQKLLRKSLGIRKSKESNLKRWTKL